MYFSDELERQLDQSSAKINRLTHIVNKKIADFRDRSDVPQDVLDLATILSVQISVLEEKYSVLMTLVTDVYKRLPETAESPSKKEFNRV